MGVLKRAWLYITRKRGKTLLLMGILLVIGVFILSALTIGRTAESSRRSILEAIGGKFTITIGNGRDNPYNVQEEIGEGRYAITNIGPRLTQENIDEVMSLGDIRRYNAGMPTDAVVPDLELVEGSLPPTEGFEHLIRGYAVSGSESSDYFVSGMLSLAEGRHIVPGDTESVLISNEFAEKNNLKLGDTMYFEISDEAAAFSGIQAGIRTPVKIIGIFSRVKDAVADAGAMSQPINLAENLYFTDMSTHASMYGQTSDFYQATFYAADPGQIRQIAERVRSLDTLDWKQFEVVIDTEEYDNAIKPVESLNSAVGMMLLISIIVSVVILSLVLTLWVRGRVHEAGVFIAAGIGKTAVFRQFLTEALLIAAAAFCLSYLIGNAAAKKAGDTLMNTAWESQDGQASGEGGSAVSAGAAVVGDTEEISSFYKLPQELDMSVQPVDFIQMCVVVTLVILLSVFLAFLQILCLSPKKILSLMS